MAARLSEAAYPADQNVKFDFSTFGMRHVSNIENDGTFCTIFVDARNCMWLAFRGTQLSEWHDINADRKFLPTKELPGLAHRGFVEALNSVWAMVEAYCADHLGRLVVTGHSLGAALGSLAARRLGVARRKLGLSKPDLITFGCPLVGSPSWIRSLYWSCGDVIRVTNGGDPIPWLFAWPIYQHPDTSRIHLDGEGQVAWNPSRWSQLRQLPCGRIRGIVKFCQAVWQTRSFFRAWLKVTRVLDHGIHRYRGQIIDLYQEMADETIL